MKPIKRTQKGFDGTALTTHHVSQLLPQLLSGITANYSLRPDMILAMWPQIIGPKLAPMTEAASFQEGVLLVHVRNSTLYSLLQRYEKRRILQQFRDKFPTVEFKNLVFRIG
jgi:predicted nucleic acid-binding Zn ribbon protein